jgi:hypothetical protein
LCGRARITERGRAERNDEDAGRADLHVSSIGHDDAERKFKGQLNPS